MHGLLFDQRSRGTCGFCRAERCPGVERFIKSYDRSGDGIAYRVCDFERDRREGLGAGNVLCDASNGGKLRGLRRDGNDIELRAAAA